MIFNLLRVSSEELAAYLDDSSLLEETIYENGDPDIHLVDIDKSWEGILFILTGQNLDKLDHPLGAALFSGQLVDPEQDLGYGPANYLTPEQVRQISGQLAAFSAADVKSKFDPVKMTELSVYPQIWNRQDAEIFDYLLEYFEEVQSFYQAAAGENQAVITFLN